MTAERNRKIEDVLSAAFTPTRMLVRDQSHLHAGHAGAQDGKGHFAVDIVQLRLQDFHALNGTDVFSMRSER